MDSLGISKLDLKRQNRMQILRLLRNNGPISRIDIAHTIHITKAAVTIITNEMIREGILVEIGEQAPSGKVSRGRKKILLDIHATWRLVLGISLQGGWVDVGLCTLNGAIVEHHSVAIQPEATMEQLLVTIRSIYGDLAYKNDLRQDSLIGVGVSVDPAYFAMCGIEPGKDGQNNFSVLEKALHQLFNLPAAFGELTEAISIAESDFCPGCPSAQHQVVLQMGGSFGSCVTIGQESYRGAHGHACRFENLALGDTRSTVKNALSKQTIARRLNELHIQQLSPALDSQSADNQLRAEWLFCRSGFIPEDPAIRRYFEEIRAAYASIFETVITILDPEKIIIHPDECVLEALSQAIASVNARLGRELIRLSRFDQTNFFLTGAALAVRECFTNRGGALPELTEKDVL